MPAGPGTRGWLCLPVGIRPAHKLGCMAMAAGSEPSWYELQAWENIQRLRDRPAARVVRAAGDRMASSVAAVGRKASELSGDHPKVRAAIGKGQLVAAEGAHWARDAVPDAVNVWGRTTAGSAQRMLSRAARVGLSPRRVVSKHQKVGHAVNRLADVRAALDWALSLDEPSVIITRWPCVLKRFSEQDKVEFPGAFTEKFAVGDRCIGCRLCLKAGCPAISFDHVKKRAVIAAGVCVGCGVCAQVCPQHAIVREEK